MSNVAIRVEGLSKRSRIGVGVQGYKTLRESVTAGAATRLVTEVNLTSLVVTWKF